MLVSLRRGSRRGRDARLAFAMVVPLLAGCGSGATPSPAPSGSPVAPAPSAGAADSTATPATPPPPASAAPSLSPSPSLTPTLVPDPLDGVLVSAEVAARHPIAVMVDDLGPARPQSGFTDASVVWQAPAEGGIPRYMLLFSEGDPPAVGPVRSAREYYVAWAAEWDAVYVHVGGSPQALSTLASQGTGQLVWNADEFRWGGTYLWRILQRAAPHNVYTDGRHLRALAARIGATDGGRAPIWRFAPDAPLATRPVGGTITVVYPQNTIRYAYDRVTNTYRRSVTGESTQVDAGTKQAVAPRNVVVMYMRFGPLNDGQPQKQRLEADIVGSGMAWMATNGRTTVGTWRKDAIDGPTRLFDADGDEVTLTVGQTFVQVLPTGSAVSIVPGSEPSPPTIRPDRMVRG